MTGDSDRAESREIYEKSVFGDWARAEVDTGESFSAKLFVKFVVFFEEGANGAAPDAERADVGFDFCEELKRCGVASVARHVVVVVHESANRVWPKTYVCAGFGKG